MKSNVRFVNLEEENLELKNIHILKRNNILLKFNSVNNLKLIF